MKTGRNYKFWFCTGSQDLYGDECLRKVAEHSRIIVEELNKSGMFPYEIIWKPTLITNELIRKTFNEANADEDCAGVITWMHTFSPAKSWILGLKEYRKPLCHLHTQFNQEIPYDTIDMDFMNENQSAHGGREYGHMVTRMGIERKVIVGHWADKKVQERLASWMRTAVGIMESSHIRVCRVADNMRNVAVTEGDKVEAQIPRLKRSANIISSLDALSTLAKVAVDNDYVRPEINNEGILNITDGRHPVVEKVIGNGEFVSNNTTINNTDHRLLLITGPNMAGKSTYMRQVALITLMAQIGSFVPAKSANISICDKIFTRCSGRYKNTVCRCLTNR